MFSLDVECVAVGPGHNDRSPATAALVDFAGNTLGQWTIKPDRRIVSYLTPLTGLRSGDLDHGCSLRTAQAEIRGFLGPNATLVGQSPSSDIAWLELREGVDFLEAIDLAVLYQGKRNGRVHYSSLRHEAMIVLGRSEDGDAHSPLEDAQLHMQLYRRYLELCATPRALQTVKNRLANTKPAQGVVAKLGRDNRCWGGVCMSAFNQRFCICGQPIKSASK